MKLTTLLPLAGGVAGQTKANAHRVPGRVSGLVDTAATRLQDSLTQPDDPTGQAAQVSPEVRL